MAYKSSVMPAGSAVAGAQGAANTLAQRNGTNAQIVNIYGTYTGPSDYERLQIVTRAGAYSSITQSEAGTGVARHLALETIGSSDLLFRTNNVLRWKVNASGVLLAEADNLYSVGVSTGNRPSSIFVRNSLNVQKYNASYAFIADTNQVKASSGSKTMPGYSFVNATNSGIYYNNGVWISDAGSDRAYFEASGNGFIGNTVVWSGYLGFQNTGGWIRTFGGSSHKYIRFSAENPSGSIYDAELDSTALTLRSDYPLSWSSTTNATGTTDVSLYRDDANTLALKNGANPQALRIYNTYNDASNYERASFSWSSNVFTISTVAAGMGLARDIAILTGAGTLYLGTSGTNRWLVTSSMFAPNLDNAYDIGSNSTNNRIRSGYFRTSVSVLNSANLNRFKADTSLTYSYALRVGAENTGVYAKIDSAKVVADTLKFYIGNASYNAIKGSSIDWLEIVLALGMFKGLIAKFLTLKIRN